MVMSIGYTPLRYQNETPTPNSKTKGCKMCIQVTNNADALERYEKKINHNQTEFEQMKDELILELEIDYNVLISRFDKIVEPYGFDYKFKEFAKDEL